MQVFVRFTFLKSATKKNDDKAGVGSIPQLVAWLAAAHDVVTVNSAASILCSAVRESWHHVPDLDPIHDWQHLKQIVIARV